MATRTVRTTKSRHRPERHHVPWAVYAAPWAVGVLVAAAGAAIHYALGRRLPDAAWGTAGVLACTTVLTGLAWGYSAAREQLLRWHTAAVTAAAGLTVMISLIVGPARPWLWAQGFGVVLVAASWNIRRLDVIRGEGRDDHPPAKSGLDELVGLPGAKAKLKSADGPRREIDIRTAGGQDYTDVQKAASAINALSHLPPGSTRVVAHPDDSARATVVQVTEDVLRNPLNWPGPSAPGGSIAEPLIHGLYEDALPAQVWLPGNWSPDRPRDVAPRNACHFLIMGMSGAGKTICGLILAVEILTRRDAVLIWVDVVKGEQSAGPIRGGVACFVTDRAAVKQLFVGVRAAVTWRAQWLGERGFREWWPGCGLPYLVIWVEEASQAIPDGDVLTRLTEVCRSVGISLMVSMQRASGDNIPTSARSNLGGSLCFGVNEKTGGLSDAQFALSEETIAAGARPETWGTSKPGYHYVEAPGVPNERWSVRARSYYEDDGPLADAVAQWAHVRQPLDEGTAAAIGPVFEAGRPTTGSVAPAAARPAATPSAAGTVTQPPTSGGHAQMNPYDEDDDGADDDGDWTIPAHPEPDIAAAIDPRAELPPPAVDVDLNPPADGSPPLTPDERMDAFRGLLVGFMERGQDEVQMADLVDEWDRTVGPFRANQRPHLHNMINALIELGQVERCESGRGRYRLCLLVAARNGHRP